MARFFLLTLIICFGFNALSQISEGGTPYSFQNKSSKKIKYVSMETVDNQKLIKNGEPDNFKKLKFATSFQVNLSSTNSGKVYTGENGEKIWQVGIRSQSAFSIGLLFSTYKLPPNAKLFIYSADKSHVIGAFTSLNNKKGEMLAVQHVKSDEIVVEYIEPANVDFPGELVIGKVSHAFIDVFKSQDEAMNEDLSCMVNINCEVGDEWQDEKRSVCKIIVDGDEICTGVLVNNSRQDGTPYVLTANHCIDKDYLAPNSVFIFGYESHNCDGYFGPLDKSISGSELVATGKNNKLDFTLVELSVDPPAKYAPYFAGWDVTETPAQNSVAIHHPDGVVKKISVDNDPTENGYFTINNYMRDSYWKIDRWDIGATVKGSSGGPLFNQNHQLVGTLSGGNATCYNPVKDYYTKMVYAWDTFSELEYQLKNWLSGGNDDVTSLGAYDPYIQNRGHDVEIVRAISPSQNFIVSNTILPSVKILNNGNEVITSLSVNYKLDDGQTISKQWNGSLLSKSSEIISFPQVSMDEGDHTIVFSVSLNNGINDEYPDDNVLTREFTVELGEMVQLTLQTDENGNETSWVIKNSSNEVVYAGDELLSDYLYTKSLSLPNGCYTFTVFDKMGDGICCDYGSGNFSLRNSSTGQIIGSGDVFEEIDEYFFCIGQEPDKYDVAISEIIIPEREQCNGNSFSPSVVVKNFGSESIRNYSIKFNNDWDKSLSKEITNLLPSKGTDTIILKESMLIKGDYDFSAEVILNDGFEEKDTQNNILTKEVTIGDCNIYSLSIQPDNYGNEILWTVSLEDGEIIYQGGPYREGDKNIINEEFYLSYGQCYTFSIFDVQGDGICCGYGNGKYSLINEMLNDTLLSGSDYQASEEKTFCLERKEPPDSTTEVYPNPGKGFFNISQHGEGLNEIYVYDCFGHLIHTDICEGEGIIQVKLYELHLQKGLYIIQVKSKSQKKAYKIVIY